MVATVTSLSSAAVTTRYFERDGYYAKADPEHRKASRWHGRGAAIRETLDFVEGHLLAVRQWDREARRHVRVPAPSMVAATFRHKANRNLEPHLHTHAVIANMARRPDGSLL